MVRTAAIEHIGQETLVMEAPRRDASMEARTALGQELISRDTASAICKMIVTELYRGGELVAHEPAFVEDGTNVWRVLGSRVLKQGATAADRGPVRMAIS